MKKILLFSTVSIGLLLAVSAFAMDYAPGSNHNSLTPASGTMVYSQAMPQGATGIRTFGSSVMPSGIGYQIISSQPSGLTTAYGYSRQVIWFDLMSVITIVLVWINLLLLMAFLWKHVKKHGYK